MNFWRGCIWGIGALITGVLGFGSEAEVVPTGDAGWAQFRGARRDGVSEEKGLLQTWPDDGPRVVWTAKGAGKGFSSPIVAGGRVIVTGDFGEETAVVAYDWEGKEVWRATNGAAWLNQYQGARA